MSALTRWGLYVRGWSTYDWPGPYMVSGKFVSFSCSHYWKGQQLRSCVLSIVQGEKAFRLQLQQQPGDSSVDITSKAAAQMPDVRFQC